MLLGIAFIVAVGYALGIALLAAIFALMIVAAIFAESPPDDMGHL